MTTTSRLLGLLSLLQTSREWPGSLLASRLGVSDRTVRRDIDRLREMGYSIRASMGPEGGYRLDSGSELPPLLFDDDQALAVAIALRAAPAMGAGIGEAAIRALGTIRQVMPVRLRHRLDAFQVTAIGRPGDEAVADASLDILVTLARAIRDQQTLRFDYAPRAAAEPDTAASDKRDPQARRAEPHHLVTSHGRWYLVAWDLDQEEWRTYRADRIRPRIPLGAPFTPRAVPGGEVDAFVSARFKGSDTDDWPCRGRVVIHLPAHAVLPYAGDGKVTAIDDRTCLLEAGARSWGALAASVGRFEAPMDVVGPPELASAFAALAERYARTSRTGSSLTS